MENDLSNQGGGLDLQKLENVRQTPDKTVAACPACREEGRDRSGNHLSIFPSGRYACVVHQGSAPGARLHRKRIFALAGRKLPVGDSPVKGADLQQARHRDACEMASRLRTRAAMNRALPAILKDFAWPPTEVLCDSPIRSVINLGAQAFLQCVFLPDELVWTGQVTDTGHPRHSGRWRTCAEWAACDPRQVGPFTTPAVWEAGTISRAASNVEAAPHVVLDFDTIRGRKPRDDKERLELVQIALAVSKWLREEMRWRLAAILHTGGKGLHCWFEDPGPEAVASLKVVAPELGLDTALIGHPAQPCRLPQQRHEQTGNLSHVWWLAEIHRRQRSNFR